MDEPRRPLAHVAVGDDCRAAITGTLRALGWSLVEHPTGVHLLDAISGLILGDRADAVPDLLVVDDRAPGCAGHSIARGLAELGVPVHAVVVGADPERGDGAGGVLVASRREAARVVTEYARALAHGRAQAHSSPPVDDGSGRAPDEGWHRFC